MAWKRIGLFLQKWRNDVLDREFVQFRRILSAGIVCSFQRDRLSVTPEGTSERSCALQEMMAKRSRLTSHCLHPSESGSRAVLCYIIKLVIDKTWWRGRRTPDLQFADVARVVARGRAILCLSAASKDEWYNGINSEMDADNGCAERGVGKHFPRKTPRWLLPDFSPRLYTYTVILPHTAWFMAVNCF